MTKLVRIENADTSNHVVVVQTFDVNPDGGEDILVHEEELTHPTALTDAHIFPGRYVKVSEKAAA